MGGDARGGTGSIVRGDRQAERGVLDECDVVGVGTNQPRDLGSNLPDAIAPSEIEACRRVLVGVLLHCFPPLREIGPTDA